MSDSTVKFKSGERYRFRPKPGKYIQNSRVAEHYTLTLVYLRDAPGAHRVTHHIFQRRGGALECFTDEQVMDYQITKK